MAGSKQTKVAKEKPKYGNPVKSKRAAPAPAPVEESSDNEAPSDDGSELAFEDIESFIRAQSLEGTEIGKAMGAKGDAGSADDDEEDAEEVDSEEEAYLAMMAEKAQAVKEGSEESEEDDEDESDDEEEEKRRPGDGQREINNIPALESRLSDIRLAQPGVAVPWIETMVVTSKESLSLAPEFVHDDTKREAAFYEQALECAMEGKKRVIAAGVPFSRPADYFAEMVKSDEHMERVRQSLVEESAAIKRAEEMKRLREQKKFGKKVQQATLQEREKRKKEDLNKIDKLKRKRKELAGGGGAPDDFGVDIDFSDDEKPRKKAKKGQLAEKSSKRKAKDAKYSFGGHRKFAKSNDRESLDAFDMDSKKMKAPFGAGKKFKAGKAGKTGKGGKPMRPGKSKRMAGKGKGRK